MTESTTASTPGEELKRLRAKRGWTLQQVAEKTGLARVTVTRHENDWQCISADAALRYAELYRVSVQRFYQPRRLANG